MTSQTSEKVSYQDFTGESQKFEPIPTIPADEFLGNSSATNITNLIPKNIKMLGGNIMDTQNQKYLDSKFDHIDYVLTEIKDTIQENKKDNKELIKEIQSDNKKLKNTIILTGLSVVVSLIGIILAVMANSNSTINSVINAFIGKAIK